MPGLAYTAQYQPVLLSDTIGHFGDLEDVGDVLAISRLESPLHNICLQIRSKQFDSIPKIIETALDRWSTIGDLGDVGDVIAVSRLGSPLNNVCPQTRK